MNNLKKYERLKIACIITNIQGISVFASAHGVTPKTIYNVCERPESNDRLTRAIDEKIEEAERIFASYLRRKKEVAYEA